MDTCPFTAMGMFNRSITVANRREIAAELAELLRVGVAVPESFEGIPVLVLEHRPSGRRIVIDTKFTSILTSGWYREETLRSGYLYQMYAYLRSQAGQGDPVADWVEGVLLHPSVGRSVDETAMIQGHAIRFATVDLAAESATIRRQLLKVVEPPFQIREQVSAGGLARVDEAAAV